VFRLKRPSPSHVAAFLASQQAAAFTYAEVGATRGDRPPAGYTVDRNRIRLGTGAEAFRRAAGALCRWQMLRIEKEIERARLVQTPPPSAAAPCR